MSAQPFVNFREILRELPGGQQQAAVGKSSYRLIERGVVQWEDVVTPHRVRTLQEVVARERLTVETMTKNGVPRHTAEQAWASVNTPEHKLIEAHRDLLLSNLKRAGLSNEQITQGFAERVVAKVPVKLVLEPVGGSQGVEMVAEPPGVILKYPVAGPPEYPVAGPPRYPIAGPPPKAALIKKNLDLVYEKAPQAKRQVDALADEVAEAVDHGAKVAKAPVKGKARALEKAMNDYGGDVTKLKDLARNTIVSPNMTHEQIESLLVDHGATVKVITADADPMGYSGINISLPTPSGLRAEIQVNTDVMIYAKEKPEIAKALIGEARYNEISVKTGLPGGQGHTLYEEWRSLPVADPGRARLEAESRLYYDQIRERAGSSKIPKRAAS